MIMVPLRCRLLISAASFIVPKALRPEWRREWHAEVWHKAQSGASKRELFGCARGVFRDAAWLWDSQRRNYGLDLFRKPLRTEASLVAVALCLAFITGSLTRPLLPYAHADRLFVLERKIPFMGARSRLIDVRLLDHLREAKSIERTTRFANSGGQLALVRVSDDFFDMLGARPMLGRLLSKNDPPDHVVVTYNFWTKHLKADPKVVGRKAMIYGREFTVNGVLPSDFVWTRTDFTGFVPLSRYYKASATAILLHPGASQRQAQKDLQALSRWYLPRVLEQPLELAPVVRDTRWDSLAVGLGAALIGAFGCAAFLAIRGLGGPRYWFMLSARVLLLVTAASLINRILVFAMPAAHSSTSIFQLWVFLLACSAICCLATIDHLGRCPVCFRKLRMPAPLGSWSSQILDQPATEYLCPAGHGTLYIAETHNAPDHWTILDESWRDLFAHIK